MNHDDNIRKLLLNVKNGEKGWRKTLASAEGTFSRRLAEENLRRLADLRETLLAQLNPVDLRKQQIIDTAIQDGIITDVLNDGISERLLRDR